MDRRILVVEDSELYCQQLSQILAGPGREVALAHDGTSALELLVDRPYSLVITDLALPGVSGLDLIREIRRMGGEERFMPIIMLTGYADMQRVNAALNAGMTEFLRKPVTAKDILLRLQAAILNARPFVTAGQYFGPDRRRRRDEPETAPKRRASDRPAIEI